ncbi:NmrA domain-containing protein [Mycena sanguinolenta]|uniref:NmrA domain-containing protein n=1 Tax=Mycena sanguinolenta TaxID=230812 RepID=A0A8H6XU32_9AGAR|nr:NmrA domain-containing protein [Mycena sanguinolenta]
MPARIVSVFGATGTQGRDRCFTSGNAVIRTLLKDGTFTPRAIVRNPDSEAALKLKGQGIEVVKGDGLDKESLVGALRGSEAVLGVTAPIFPLKAEGEGPNELTWGKNMVDAAKEAGVNFFIWSSLPSVKKLSDGKYTNVIHYDQKAAVEEYLKSSGLANASFHLGGFLENYWKFGLLKKTDTGYDVAVPHYKVTDRQAFTWVEQAVPATVLALLKNYTDPSKNISGKTYPIVNANLSYSELAALTGKALGVEVTFTTAPAMGMGPIDEMYQSHAEYSGLYTATSVPNPDLVALGVKFGTIQEFLETEVKPRFGA